MYMLKSVQSGECDLVEDRCCKFSVTFHNREQ